MALFTEIRNEICLYSETNLCFHISFSFLQGWTYSNEISWQKLFISKNSRTFNMHSTYFTEERMINKSLCVQILFIRQFVYLERNVRKIVAQFYVLNILVLIFLTLRQHHLWFFVFHIFKLLMKVRNYKISCKIIELNLWRSEIIHRSTKILCIRYFHYIIINESKPGYLC